MEQFSYTNVMAVPRLVKVTLNMGVGEAVGDQKIMDNAVDDMMSICRAETRRQQRAQIRSRIQDSRRLSGRLQSDAAPRAHVRVCRAPGRHRDSAYARFPRLESAFVRWAWQLFDGCDRADYFSRRSTTTRSTQFGVSTSRSRRRRGPMRKVSRCSRHSVFHSARRTRYGKDIGGRTRASKRDRDSGEIRAQAQGISRRSSTIATRPMTIVGRRR